MWASVLATMVLARGFFNLVDFNKIKVVVRGDKVGVRLKHAEVLPYESPRILWDRLALHGSFEFCV